MQNLIWEALQNILILESHQIRLVLLFFKEKAESTTFF